jgi:hypothetical protein
MAETIRKRATFMYNAKVIDCWNVLKGSRNAED